MSYIVQTTCPRCAKRVKVGFDLKGNAVTTIEQIEKMEEAAKKAAGQLCKCPGWKEEDIKTEGNNESKDR